MEDFLIYGSQYYRAPTPLADQWANDIRNMRAHGFNTIKIWAQWRSNCPEEGVFDFDDLQKIMDLSSANDMKVVINIIMDAAPAWLFQKHPDSIMVLANGEKLYPQSVSHRQMGGTPGPCYHHVQSQAYKYEFIARLAQTFAHHPALLYWDLWNEPELTCALAREADMRRMACYCPSSIESFKRWLETKYQRIDRLNAAWQRNYFSFNEVEAPRNSATFKDMIDWRAFFADTLVQDLNRRIETVRQFDADHPVMVHTVPLPYFNMVNACSDDYALAKNCDLYGNSIGNQPMMAAMAMSAAPGKKVINAEIHVTTGESFLRPAIHTLEDFRRQIYVPLARGIKGFLYWQYRPELCGREGPAWGLTKLDGRSDYRLDYAQRIGRALLRHEQLILGVRPEKPKIAIVRDYCNEIFAWCAQGTVQSYFKSVGGAFDALYELNYQVDILSVQQAIEQGLKGYQLVYYPMPYYMTERMAQLLRDYVEGGGTLVAEANFGAYRDEVNLHSTQVPGYGFDEIFGVQEGRCTSTASLMAAYGKQWQNDAEDKNLFGVEEGPDGPWKGYLFLEELIAGTAEVLGVYDDGRNRLPILTKNVWGKGQAVLCGTLLGAAYASSRDENTLKLIGRLAELAGVAPAPCAAADARIDLLRDEGHAMIVVDNRADQAREIPVDLGAREVPFFRDIETDERFETEDGRVWVRVPANSVRVYAGYAME